MLLPVPVTLTLIAQLTLQFEMETVEVSRRLQLSLSLFLQVGETARVIIRLTRVLSMLGVPRRLMWARQRLYFIAQCYSFLYRLVFRPLLGDDPKNFTLFIKNNVQFEKFHFHK